MHCMQGLLSGIRMRSGPSHNIYLICQKTSPRAQMTSIWVQFSKRASLLGLQFRLAFMTPVQWMQFVRNAYRSASTGSDSRARQVNGYPSDTQLQVNLGCTLGGFDSHLSTPGRYQIRIAHSFV